MSKCHHVFDTNIYKFINEKSKVFDEEFLNNTFRQYKKIMKLLPTADLLNQDIMNLLTPYGLRSELMTFYQKPFFIGTQAHVDITSNNTRHWYSLNVAIYGQGKMFWFDDINDGVVLNHKDSPDDILYIEFNDLTVLGNPIDVWSTGKVSLVKTGIPHYTHNDSIDERLVVSIRWDEILSWEESIDLIDRFILNH